MRLFWRFSNTVLSSNLRGSSGGRVSAVGNNEKIGSKLRLFRRGRHQHEVTRDTKGEMMANSCHFYLTHGLALCKAKTKCLGIGHQSILKVHSV